MRKLFFVLATVLFACSDQDFQENEAVEPTIEAPHQSFYPSKQSKCTGKDIIFINGKQFVFESDSCSIPSYVFKGDPEALNKEDEVSNPANNKQDLIENIIQEQYVEEH